jgi:1-deoxy-D-xylulose-5-phosphate synthase
MLGRSYKAWESLINTHQISLYDVSRIKPLPINQLSSILSNYTHVITIEEQTLDGGFGSAICEVICDEGLNKKVLRLGLPEMFPFENGTRDQLIDLSGLSVDNIVNRIKIFLK